MSFGLEVNSLCPAQDAALVDFLDRVQVPGVQSYLYPFYRDALMASGVGEPLYLGAFRAGELCGVLPCFRSGFGPESVICSLPVMGPNAGIVCSEHDPGFVNIHADLLAMLRTAAKQALACSVITPFLFRKFWLYESSFSAVRYRDSLFARLRGFKISRNRQRAAEQAKKQGVTVSVEGFTLAAEAAYQRACQERAMPVRPGFEQIVKGPAKYVKFYVARQDGDVVAGLVCLWGPRTATYCQPFATEQGRKSQAATLVTMTAILEAQAAGLWHWHWESSPLGNEGVTRFKNSFGGTVMAQYATYAHSDRLAELHQLGGEELTKRYPWYYVYPFDALEKNANPVSA